MAFSAKEQQIFDKAMDELEAEGFFERLKANQGKSQGIGNSLIKSIDKNIVSSKETKNK